MRGWEGVQTGKMLLSWLNPPLGVLEGNGNMYVNEKGEAKIKKTNDLRLQGFSHADTF